MSSHLYLSPSHPCESQQNQILHYQHICICHPGRLPRHQIKSPSLIELDDPRFGELGNLVQDLEQELVPKLQDVPWHNSPSTNWQVRIAMYGIILFCQALAQHIFPRGSCEEHVVNFYAGCGVLHGWRFDQQDIEEARPQATL